MDVRKLPAGPPPKLDTVVDTTLFHDGKAIPLYLHGRRVGGAALGSLDGTPYIVTGDQLYRVGDGGSLTAIGTPHETYSYWPRMSIATGHVFFADGDRGTGKTAITVMDARTGRVLSVDDNIDPFHDWSTDTKIDPRDLPVVVALAGEAPGVLAVSPDGRTGLGLQPDPGWDHPHTEILDQWSLGTKPEVVRHLSFLIPNASDEITVDDPVFEDDHTFLVRAYMPNWSGKGPIRMFVARCTLQGACERTTEITTTEDVSIAGAGGVLVPGHFPDS